MGRYLPWRSVGPVSKFVASQLSRRFIWLWYFSASWQAGGWELIFVGRKDAWFLGVVFVNIAGLELWNPAAAQGFDIEGALIVWGVVVPSPVGFKRMWVELV